MIRNITTVLLLSVVCSYAQLQPGYTFLTVRTNTDINSLIIPNITPASIGAISTNALPGLTNGFIGRTDATNIVNGIAISSNWVNGAFVTNTVIGLGASSGFIRLPDATNVVNGIGIVSNWVSGSFVTNVVNSIGSASNWVDGAFVTNTVTGYGYVTASITNQSVLTNDAKYLAGITNGQDNVTLGALSVNGSVVSITNNLQVYLSKLSDSSFSISNAITKQGTVGSAFNVNTAYKLSGKIPSTVVTNFTMSAWVKMTAQTVSGNIMSMNVYPNGLSLREQNSILYWLINAGNSSYSVSLSPGVWTFIVWTVDRGNSTLYVNGASYTATPSANWTNTAITTFEFGDSGIGQCFNGIIDECAVWTNRVLSQGEVTALYASGAGTYGVGGVAPFDSSIVAGYHLDENSGTAVTAFVGTNGTLSSASWTTGFIASAPGTGTVQVVKSSNGILPGETGRIQFGSYDGLAGTLNTYEGISHSLNILGTPKLVITNGGISVPTNMLVGGTTTHTKPVVINGSSDNIQLSAKANSTQNSNVLQTYYSDGSKMFAVDPRGWLQMISSGGNRGNTRIYGEQALLMNLNTDRTCTYGDLAGYSLNTGDDNSFFGYGAGYADNTGSWNSYFGGYSGYNAQSSLRNTGIGFETLYGGGVAGSDNTAGGFNAGKSNSGGNSNTYYGAYAGKGTTTGSRDVYIGSCAGMFQTTASEQFIIDNQNRGTAAGELTNALMVGTFAANRTNQTLAINANVSTISLTVGGNSVLTNIPTESTNLSAGVLVYTNGILYGGTNIPAGGGIQLTDVTNVVNGIAVSSNWVDMATAATLTNGVVFTNNSIYTQTVALAASALQSNSYAPNLLMNIDVYHTNALVVTGSGRSDIRGEYIWNSSSSRYESTNTFYIFNNFSQWWLSPPGENTPYYTTGNNVTNDWTFELIEGGVAPPPDVAFVDTYSSNTAQMVYNMANSWVLSSNSVVYTNSSTYTQTVLKASTAWQNSSNVTNFSYDSDGTGINILSYIGSGTKIIVPDMINGLPVRSVGEGAFGGVDTFTDILVQPGVTNVGFRAMYLNSVLTNVSLPNGLLEIGSQCFSADTALTNVTIPATVTKIAPMAFSDCANLNAVYFLGDAPDISEGTIFDNTQVTNYCRSGASGFGTVFDGRPVVYLGTIGGDGSGITNISISQVSGAVSNAMINGMTGTVSAGMADLGTGFLTNNYKSSVALFSNLNISITGTNTYTSAIPWSVSSVFDQINLTENESGGEGNCVSFRMHHFKAAGNTAMRQILVNESGGNGRLVWQMRDGNHTANTMDKMWLHSKGILTVTSNIVAQGSIQATGNSSLSNLAISGTAGIGSYTATNGIGYAPLVIGATTNENHLTTEGSIEILGNTDTLRVSLIGAGTPAIQGKRCGGTLEAPTAVGAAVNLISLNGAGWTGTNWSGYVANIGAYAETTWTTNSNPTQWRFHTTPTGGITRIERMRIEADGDVTISNNLTVVAGTIKVGGGVLNPGGITVPISLLPYVVNSTCTFTRAMIETNESWYIIPTNTVYFSADSTLTDSNIVSRFSLDIWYNDKTFGFDGGLSNTVTLVSNQPNSIIWFKGWGTTNMVGR